MWLPLSEIIIRTSWILATEFSIGVCSMDKTFFVFKKVCTYEKHTWRKRCWLIRWTNKKERFRSVSFSIIRTHFLFKKKKETRRINERTIFNNGIHQIFIRDTIYSKEKEKKNDSRKRKSLRYRASFTIIEASHLIIKVVVICIAIYLGNSSESFSSPYPGQRLAERTIIR